MENTAAEEMYDFTKNRREKINLELSKIRSLYGREDVVYRFNAYKKAKDKDDIARKKGRSGYSGLPSARIELESACKSVGIEKTPDELIKDDSVIKTIHTRSEIISDQFLPILYKEYKNTPMTSDYMNRIIHRLTKSDTYIKKDDENRTIILKKFVMGGGKGFKTLNTGEIIEWAEEKMNASEKEQYDLQSDSQKKLELAVSRIDNSIFDRSLTQALKQTKCLIENFDKYVLMSKEGKIVDSNSNETIIISDIILKEITTIKLKNLMCKLRFEFTNVSVIENIKLLYNIFNNDYPANTVVEFIDFVAALNVDFKKQLHSLCYISREGKKKTLEERYCDVLKKRNRKMKLLNLCEDLANGDFKSNGGNTRKYLYYFAIMFDMSEALKKNDHYNEDTKEVETEFGKRADMQAYLFEDYYSDNIMKFLLNRYEREKHIKSLQGNGKGEGNDYETEPRGDGINYKNYAEMIYLYFLYRKDLNLTPGERIDMAEKIIAKCSNSKEKITHPIKGGETNDTVGYKNSYMESVLDREPSEVGSYLMSTEYDFMFNEGKSITAISSEEVYARDAMEIWSGSLEDEYVKNVDSSTLKREIKDIKEAAESDEVADRVLELSNIKYFKENSIVKWSLSEKLRKKYTGSNDKEFFLIIDLIEQRLNKRFVWLSSRKINELAELLTILYEDSNSDTFISGKELQAMIRKKTGGLYNGYLFQDDVEMLKSIGLDIKWKKIKKPKKAAEDITEEEKVYALCGREYQNDSELDAIIKSLNIKLDKTLLWEILLERIVKKQDISRSTFIAVYYNYYLCFELDKISGVETFKDIYDDFKNKIDIELEKARFQRMSEKNILDLYVLISLCVFVVENDVLQSE